MNAEQIQALIEAAIACEHCHVEGDGRHWYATVVSSAFEGKRAVQRHQMVYATMGERIKNDEVHALAIRAHTPAEWASKAQ